MSELTVIASTNNLVPGWYAIGLRDLAGQFDWGGAPIHEYVGNGCWMSEHGEEVTSILDAELQMYVGINDADGYVKQ